VAIAGPMMNLLMALVVSVGVVIAVRAGALSPEKVGSIFRHLIVLNLTLMFFNLLPIPPLDGGAVLAWVLPRSQQNIVDFLTRWGFLILLGMVMIRPVMQTLMYPVAVVSQYWGALLVGLAGL
jgi:Zn-dependent protease